MTLALYGHPFGSFVWKPLIALYERNVTFEFRMVDPDHPETRHVLPLSLPRENFPR